MTTDRGTDLGFTLTLDAPRDAVWTCWTEARHLPAFFMPKPHRMISCDIDVRPGGRFDTVLEIAGKEVRTAGVFLEAERGRRLVFTDAYSAGWVPAPDPFMTAILEFSDAGDGGTIYTVLVRHRSPEARRRHEEMGFDPGWRAVAAQLEAHARTL